MEQHIQSYPNQRQITIQKEKCGTEVNEHYTRYNNIALHYAMQKLKTVGSFKLWAYLGTYGNYEKPMIIWLSKADFVRVTGLSDKTYRNAFDELKKQGFIQEQGKNKYIFYELPPNNDLIQIEINKCNSDGSNFSF